MLRTKLLTNCEQLDFDRAMRDAAQARQGADPVAEQKALDRAQRIGFGSPEHQHALRRYRRDWGEP